MPAWECSQRQLTHLNVYTEKIPTLALSLPRDWYLSAHPIQSVTLFETTPSLLAIFLRGANSGQPMTEKGALPQGAPVSPQPATHDGRAATEPGSVPPVGSLLDFCKCSDDHAGLWGFLSGISRSPSPLRSSAAAFSPRFTFTGSRDLGVRSRPNLSAQLSPARPERKKFRESVQTVIRYARVSQIFALKAVHDKMPLCNVLFFSSGNPGATVTERLTCSLPAKANRGSLSCRVAPGFSHVGIVPDDAVGRRIFSGISSFPRPFIPAMLHTHINYPHRLSRRYPDLRLNRAQRMKVSSENLIKLITITLSYFLEMYVFQIFEGIAFLILAARTANAFVVFLRKTFNIHAVVSPSSVAYSSKR
ncbi:hypothetical protein PR048_006889 [Dryococelus australis]|uniref:Uncharacterized protein n=1 Tax=Dryococelus australis TaxID=614101 RepID=A0ABQ9ID69_9NEOP|nr:hypothetical protein PR048_006889 [Dryococelus australis]